MHTYDISYLGKNLALCRDTQVAVDELHALAQHMQAFPHSLNPILTRIK